MKFLCIDVGSGTQDILYLDSRREIENAIQLILPSPTVIIAGKVQEATKRREAVFLTGETMGGGACTGAVRDHINSKLPVYATEEAARSLSDDMEKVASWGVKLISPDEISEKPGNTIIEMKDVCLDSLERALAAYDVTLELSAIAIAVLDHGTAPQGESERTFRFKYLKETLSVNRSLDALVYGEEDIPSHFTRMQGLSRTLGNRAPLVIMDTGAAAIMGSGLEPEAMTEESHIGVNVGNSHTVAFSLSGRRVLGMLEHHTSSMSPARLETLIENLRDGTISQKEVWDEGGHGSLVFDAKPSKLVTVTGPRRALLQASRLKPRFAAPYGSMMLAGCFGLLAGAAVKFPQWRDTIDAILDSGR